MRVVGARRDRMKNNRLRSLFSDRKFRSGALSAALSLLVVCSLLAAVFVMDTVEKKYALQADYSYNGATTQSRITTEILSSLTHNVHVYVVSSLGNQNNTILSLLDRYKTVSDHFTYSEESLARSPYLLTMFAGSVGDDQVSSDCIIVYCQDTGRARVLKSGDFPVYEYSTETGYYIQTGYNYEKPLTEAVVYVSQDNPLTVQFLTGHNELSGENITNLEAILSGANYDIRQVNLLNGDTLDPANPLMIICPKLDFSSRELSLLTEFAEDGGKFMILSDYADPLDLSNFNSLLLEYGVGFFPGLVMAESAERSGYYDDLQAFLLPYMQPSELTDPLIETNKDILIMPGTRALRMPQVTDTSLTVDPLLISGKAYIRDYTSSAPDSAEKQPTDEEGYFALGTLSTRLTGRGNVSKAVIIGNHLMFTDYWVESNTYAADFLLRSLQFLQGDAPVRLDISSKANREPLVMGSRLPTILVISLLPLLVLAVALFVLLPRKHR